MVFYFSDQPEKPAPSDLDALPPCTIFMWDRHYSDWRGVPLDELSAPANGWTRLNQFGDGEVILFQKQGQCAATPGNTAFTQ